MEAGAVLLFIDIREEYPIATITKYPLSSLPGYNERRNARGRGSFECIVVFSRLYLSFNYTAMLKQEASLLSSVVPL